MTIEWCKDEDDRVRCRDCCNYCGRMGVPVRRIVLGEEMVEWYNITTCRLHLGGCPNTLRRCGEFKQRRR